MNDNFNRRGFLKTLSLGAAAIALPRGIASGAEKQRPARPNIIVILTDDQGYGDLSSYGAKDLKTPHLDALMAAGVRMDNFYANCPVCSPTRAALLTGRYPDMVGVPGVIRTHKRNNWGHMTAEAKLLPKLLKPAGYHTAAVGKWHLGLEAPNTPIPRGFDHFHGYLGDMMDNYYTHRRHGINYMTLGEKTIDPKGHATDLFTQWAIDYVKQRAKSPKPFFLYLAYNAPHTPIQPPKDWLERVKEREKGISGRRARLVALIEHLDDGIGKVIAALKESGQADDTLVIFTSDNGGQSGVGANNGPMNGGKQQMLEGGIRVAMCAVWPGKIKPGTRCDEVAMTMDLFPTVCEAAGAKIDYAIDGVSILDGLLGKKFKIPDRYLFWMRLEGGRRYQGKIYYAVRHGRWKLMQNRQSEPMKLYDLKADPGETSPLGAEHEAYKRLSDALANHVAKADKIPWQRPGK